MSKSFLQSSEWAEFQESFGRKTYKIENKLIIKYPLPLGLSYFYCPRPYFDDTKSLKDFLKETKKNAKGENAVFLRFEPDINSNIVLEQFSNPLIKKSKCLQPQDTLICDINHTEETLLENMHPKTRYNIRLAQKHGVEIKKSYSEKDIDIFYNLALLTSERDKFNYHERSYYEKMVEILGKSKMLEIFTAYVKQNSKLIPTASILVFFYKDTAIYLHGASDHKFRNLMSPYLLQWEAIKSAKYHKCKTYDFWGIAPQIEENDHPWAGITRFKKGFAPNGRILHYPDAFDLIYQPFWYKIYTLMKKQ
jgi:lipid II:glycine glycyltransferase (peptidoglycan interpeptide bridge formation enzyme)